jgi:MFS family permease
MTRWWVIVAAGLAVFMASVDLSITNVALPTLGQVFVVPPSALEWVVLAYSLPAVAFLLPFGRWVDSVSLRGAFFLAVCGFAGASVLCGLAPSLPWLVVCRFLQGGALNYLPPFFLQNGLHASLHAIGVTVLVRGLVMGAVAPLGGFLTDRWGTRPLSLLAALCVGVGLLSLLPLNADCDSGDCTGGS